MDAEAALSRCLTLTRAAREAAEQHDWEGVSRLQGEREGVLAVAAFDHLDAEAAGRLAPRLRELVEADQDLVRCAAEARRAVLGELRRVRGRREGSARYRTAHHPDRRPGGPTIRMS